MGRRRRGWSVENLREYLDIRLKEKDLRDQQRFDAQSLAISSALQAAKEAVNKAEAANERRFEGVNEFRATLGDYQARLLPRAEYDTAHQAMEDKINTLSSRVDKAEGNKSGIVAGWQYLVGAVLLIAAILPWVVRK